MVIEILREGALCIQCTERNVLPDSLHNAVCTHAISELKKMWYIAQKLYLVYVNYQHDIGTCAPKIV